MGVVQSATRRSLGLDAYDEVHVCSSNDLKLAVSK